MSRVRRVECAVDVEFERLKDDRAETWVAPRECDRLAELIIDGSPEAQREIFRIQPGLTVHPVATALDRLVRLRRENAAHVYAQTRGLSYADVLSASGIDNRTHDEYVADLVAELGA